MKPSYQGVKQAVYSLTSNLIVIFSLLFSLLHPQPVRAQGGDELKRQFNAESGKVSFMGPANGRSLSAAKALGTSIRPQDPAMALAKRFAPEFGLQNPERNLSELKSEHTDNGQWTVRYQQKYQGIPVMGGELIVNTNERGDLYSMNGEVSPDLSLATQPTIDAAQAREIALQAVAKWYEKKPDNFTTTEPELWIYDESLLRSSSRPVELVWRMEVTPLDAGMPVRELVLINAQVGSISLHFNQVDTAWTGTKTVNRDQKLPAKTLSPNGSEPGNILSATTENIPALAPTTWYVATTGNNTNSCTSAGSPCLTISGAIVKAASSGDTIKVAIGTYIGSGTEVVLINKSITLSGGWNAGFTTQIGMSTIHGQSVRRGIEISSGVTSIIERFVIRNGYVNDGTSGAGINNWGTVTLKESTISDNSSGYSGSGGGIANLPGGVFILNSSTVSGNKDDLGGGGGIVNSSTMTLNNSTISGNTTNYTGGGIQMVGGTLTANNTSIYGNTSTYTYGAGISNNGGGGSVVIKNTILAGNLHPGGQRSDCAGTIVSSGYNLLGSVNSSDCTFVSTTGDIVGPSYLPPIDPLLTPLQMNGGNTFTHALYSVSAALNAGSPATPGSGGNACLAIDQRGVVRSAGDRCDIGAYEGSIPWATPYVVRTYTADDTAALPGIFLCDQNDPNCSSGNSHAKSAHKYAIGTYNFYATKFNRDSIDNARMAITSTVDYCDPYYGCPYDNAFWSGTQMVYGNGRDWPLADDVVAHELTHGVTQYESNLFYYYQSGAINESFSDVFGEYYDQGNGLGNDGGGFNWLVSEDVAPGGQGAIRSMSNPPAYGDPDKMSSPNYYFDSGDSGGVHSNSGINNKAVYLMVDGGSFNSKTVTSLGWEKVGAIYYEAQTNLLTSGADYSDLYYALQQACTNLIGQHGITSGDCTEVKDALDAVEMNGQPAPNFNTDAPVCSVAGTVPNIVFADDIENGIDNWSFNNNPYTRWQADSQYYGPYAQSGLHSLYAADAPAAITDARALLDSVTIPPNAYLHFAQAYDFEQSDANYDGGVIEYSTNGGNTWVDAGSLIDYNGYTGTINVSGSSPISGRSAFVGASHGYISTRLNLSSLAGQTVNFVWRMGLDPYVAFGGWWVDNVKIYNCIPDPAPANDNFSNAKVVSAVPYNEAIDTTAATEKIDDPQVNSSCDGKMLAKGQKTVWYKYLAPRTSSVFFDTFGTNYNTYIAVWTGTSPGNLALVGCDDDAANSLQSQVSFYAQTGITYYIEVAGYSGIQGGATENNLGGSLKLHATTFADVPGNHVFWRYIEGFYTRGITTGCSANPFSYCPDAPVNRAAMAVFILRAKYGSSHVPNPIQTHIFSDLPIAGQEWMQPWIEEFYEEGVTTGCGVSPLIYCPQSEVSREAMAVFLLRAKNGAGYTPPPASNPPLFADVPVAGKEWMQPWIEEFYRQGYTVGCGVAPLRYCPEATVNRAAMAVFISRVFNIPQVP